MSRPQSAAIVDVPAPIAAWLVSFGAIKDGSTVLNDKNKEIRQLRPSEWVDIQNGKARSAHAAARCVGGLAAWGPTLGSGASVRYARTCVFARRADCVRPQQVGTILAKVFVAHGQPNPVPPMRDGAQAWRGALPRPRSTLQSRALTPSPPTRPSCQAMKLPFGCTTGTRWCRTCTLLALTLRRTSKRSWLPAVSAAACAAMLCSP